MILNIRQAIIGTFVCASINLEAAPAQFPNGRFDTSGGAMWTEGSGGGTYTFSYPATGGSTGGTTGGYGIIDNSAGGGGYGLWVGNGNAAILLSTLGLEAGKTYRFSQDMKIESGTNIGGFKLDFFNGVAGAGSTGDRFPTPIGAPGSWATYTFDIVIPSTADSLKVVPLWGAGSRIGFDNIGYDDTALLPPPPSLTIPNGDFETPNGASWQPVGSAETTWSYPTTGGNPGGYGVMNNTGAGFGIWVANGGAELTMTSLGLTAGQKYTFLMDMKILIGSVVGGFKVDFVPSGTTNDIFPAKIEDGSTWKTYSFEVTIPSGTTGIKLVPLWGKKVGESTSVGYDNIRIQAPTPPAPLTADINTGTVLTWTAENPNSTYQPQESSDEDIWTNIGPLISGNSISSVFTTGVGPFFRAMETVDGAVGNGVLNPGFEITEAALHPSFGAVNWKSALPAGGAAMLSVESAYNAILPRGGTKMFKMESTTPATGPVTPPNTDVRSVFTPVMENTIYDFSFYAAHPVKIGGANPQFSLFFYNSSNEPVGAPIFETFAGVGSTWTKVARTFTTPAGATQMTIGWIQAMGAGNGWQWVTLIDDVSLPTTGAPGGTVNRVATAGPGVQVSWTSSNGVNYQVKSSADLVSFANYGAIVSGNGAKLSVADRISQAAKFFKVEVAP